MSDEGQLHNCEGNRFPESEKYQEKKEYANNRIHANGALGYFQSIHKPPAHFYHKSRTSYDGYYGRNCLVNSCTTENSTYFRSHFSSSNS